MGFNLFLDGICAGGVQILLLPILLGIFTTNFELVVGPEGGDETDFSACGSLLSNIVPPSKFNT